MARTLLALLVAVPVGLANVLLRVGVFELGDPLEPVVLSTRVTLAVSNLIPPLVVVALALAAGALLARSPPEGSVFAPTLAFAVGAFLGTVGGAVVGDFLFENFFGMGPLDLESAAYLVASSLLPAAQASVAALAGILLAEREVPSESRTATT